MQWKPDDEFVITHPSAPFYGARGRVEEENRPFPYPIMGVAITPDGEKRCWWRLDEISPAEVESPTEQIPAVTS